MLCEGTIPVHRASERETDVRNVTERQVLS